jgi:LPS export ABC transporter protein LptC
MDRVPCGPFVPVALATWLCSWLLAGVAVADGVEEAAESLRDLDAELRVSGMTFVGSRGDVSEFVVRAAQGVFVPETRIAHLSEVEVVSEDGIQGRDFEVRCDRGELDVETNDFFAEGNVRGTTGDGRRYTAPWVRYEHERALLYSDAPVVVRDRTGTFRGDGFRYFVKEERFRLLGNVSLVQTQ